MRPTPLHSITLKHALAALLSAGCGRPTAAPTAMHQRIAPTPPQGFAGAGRQRRPPL